MDFEKFNLFRSLGDTAPLKAGGSMIFGSAGIAEIVKLLDSPGHSYPGNGVSEDI